ncbi:MAG TPA: hypothetical protein VGR92_05530 [Steroidobacteraceae bacterium]|nr:hypothetical protein [Steroidobacteraceae bacterium]
MPAAKSLSVAVRLSAAQSDQGYLDALGALESVEICLLEEMRSVQKLDLILDLTSRAAEPDHILGPRLGYWTFLYGERPERIAPGLPDYLAARRAAFVRLARLLPGDRAVILREGSVKTVSHSLAATRRRLVAAASRWPAQKLAELARSAAPALGVEVELPARSRAAQIGLRAQLPLALLRNIGRRIQEKLTRERWRLGIIEQPIDRLIDGFDATRIRWLEVPFEGLLADPFGLAGPDGTLTILAEAVPWQERRGRIAAIERRRDGSLTIMPTSLTFDSHVSYPQIIADEGEIYCLPESAAQRRVQLFRAVEFPARWVPDSVLLEGFAGADATVIRFRERWWMFTGNHADQDEAKLFIFHSAGLRGPWMPHTLNPVKCDLRASRPAGTPFVGADGALYRPAQDCSRVYGGALAINRVTRLTPGEFEEEVVARLRPDPGGPCPDGLHTLSALGELTLVDGKRHEFVPVSIAAVLNRMNGNRRGNLFGHGQDRIRQPAS